MKRTWMALCIGACLLFARTADAVVLVDTGPGGTSSIGAQSLFANASHFQSLAGKFTLASPATLDSVEGWMGPFGTGGPIDVKIRANGATPGTTIFSKNYTLGSRISAGWDVFGAFNTTLPAGTYWLCFEPVANGGMFYSMPGGAASPLVAHAYLADGNPGWIAYGANPSLGFRVSGGPAFISPQGSATRQIFQAPDGNADTIKGGEGQNEAYYGHISLNGYGWALGRGAILQNGLTAGAEAVSSQSAAASRSVSWRSFQNTTASTVTFRHNATLQGQFDPASLSTVEATGAIHVLDSALFASTIAASGQSAASFLLGGVSLDAINGADGRPNLSNLFPPAARLTNDIELVTFSPNVVTLALQTGVISIAPNQTVTLLYDVSARSYGTTTSGTRFNDTLAPAPVPFTDAGGNPVTGIVPLGPSITVGEDNFLMFADRQSLSWRSAIGATRHRVYTGTQADLPALLTPVVDSCLLYDDIGPQAPGYAFAIPPPGQFFWYVAVGVSGATEGSAGGARIINSSGFCN